MTLASDNQKTPTDSRHADRPSADVAGRGFSERESSSREPGRLQSEAIPPTLLRLPDLEPMPEPDPSPVESSGAGMANSASSPSSIGPTTKTSALSNVKVAPATSEVAQTDGRVAQGRREDVGPSDLVRPPVILKAADLSVKPADPASDTVVELSSRNKPMPSTEEPASSLAESLVSVFASRRTLLVLLALIAALAIFMPRGENATSEHETPMLVESLTPPKTTLETPVARMPPATSIVTAHEVNSKLNTFGSQSGFPAAPRAESSLDSQRNSSQRPNPNTQLASMAGPIPVRTMPSSTSSLDDIEMPVVTTGETTSETRLFPTVDAIRGYSRSFAEDARKTTVEAFDAVSGSVGSELGPSPMNEPPPPADPPARLVNSRTPQGIQDWTRFLPSVNAGEPEANLSPAGTPDQAFAGTPDQAFAGSPPSDGQSAIMPTVIRTSIAPEAPSFEFALPAGSQPSGAQSPNSPGASRPVSSPEARVAMPPSSSLR